MEMNSPGRKISEARRLKGITQEELAEQSSVNLRTIQRIENGESEPRSKTLLLLCEVLGIELEELLIGKRDVNQSGLAEKVVNAVFLIILNMVLVAIISFLTMDSFANFVSRFASLLLSFFMPFFIVFFTKQMSGMERMLKFGFGFMLSFVHVMILHGFPAGWITGLFASMLIFLTVLYFGEGWVRNWESKK